MTTTDLWIRDLSGGRHLGQHGGLFSAALDVASVLLDFINEGRVTTTNGQFDVTNIESRMSGELLIEVFLETERRSGTELTESDGRRSVECVSPDHVYEIKYIEF